MMKRKTLRSTPFLFGNLKRRNINHTYKGCVERKADVFKQWRKGKEKVLVWFTSTTLVRTKL